MNLSAIDLNLLLVLDAVLAERSVVRAARRLHVTPPAVSNALNRLRAAIGDPIVTRSGRGITPTPRALQLAPAVGRALRDLDAALHGDAFDPATAAPVLTIALADAGQLARLPRLAALVTRAMPRATLRAVNVDTMIALGGLGGTEVDVAVGVADHAPGLHREHLYDERSVVIARAGHPRLGPAPPARSSPPSVTSRSTSRSGSPAASWRPRSGPPASCATSPRSCPRSPPRPRSPPPPTSSRRSPYRSSPRSGLR